MKSGLKKLVTVLTVWSVGFFSAVRSFADDIYEPEIEPVFEKSYNIFSYFIIVGLAVLLLSLITGIVLLIIFGVRRKKRREKQ